MLYHTVCVCMCVCVCLSVCLSVVCLSVCLSVCGCEFLCSTSRKGREFLSVGVGLWVLLLERQGSHVFASRALIVLALMARYLTRYSDRLVSVKHFSLFNTLDK